LALGRVNANLAEERVQTERAGFIGNDRHDAFSDVPVAQQMTQQSNEGHGAGCLIAARTLQEFSETGEGRNLERFGLDLASEQKPAQRTATFQQVFRLGALGRRSVKRRINNFLVADGNIESRPELAKLFFIQLFLLMRN